MSPLNISMEAETLNSRLWVKRLFIAWNHDQGRFHSSEGNDGAFTKVEEIRSKRDSLKRMELVHDTVRQ